jgi:galactose mutarotase-like enzyme
MAGKRRPAGQVIGGIVAGIDQQIFRTTPPANELVAKGTPLRSIAASGGGTITVGMPGGIGTLHLAADGVEAVVDLEHGGRLASFEVDGRELLVTEGLGPISWGSFPMVPYAGRVRNGRFEFQGRRWDLPMLLPPHAIHGTVIDRSWDALDDRTITTTLGPAWPFAGRAIQRFELEPGRLTCRLELHADEPMPASLGWHPWFRRRPPTGAYGTPPGPEPGELELELDARAMFRRDDDGITTRDLVVPPPPGPWDDCFTDLRRPPVLRWPGFLELTIDSDCPAWVVYTVPTEALCVEPQTAPPDALNAGPDLVEPGQPLVAEMVWTWRSLR